jgi:hypothetical protein
MLYLAYRKILQRFEVLVMTYEGIKCHQKKTNLGCKMFFYLFIKNLISNPDQGSRS